jgi:DNA-binding MarR family transcriptional regulator
MNSEMLIAAQISRARSSINRFIVHELKKNGISGLGPSHGGIFFYLFHNEPVTMKELAEAIRRDKSTITALVGKLVEKGYVQKETSLEDMRTVKVRLTEKGKAFQPVFEQISSRLIRRIWQGIDPDDQKTVIRILQQIESNFQ